MPNIFDTKTIVGLLAVTVVISLIIKYYSDVDHTITSLSPNIYAFTKVIQGQ